MALHSFASILLLLTQPWIFPSVCNSQAILGRDGLCLYGDVIRCCYGWIRERGSLKCRPVCRQPCQHGVCVGPNICQCNKGYTGAACERDENECARIPCQQRCMNTVGSFRCYCRDGYVLESDRKSCRPDNECNALRCHFGCEKKSKNKKSRCVCPRGMQLGSDDKTCQDIDECAAQHSQVCPAGRKCKNTFGSYMCMCLDGYSFQYVGGKLQCQRVGEVVSESPVDICSQGYSDCSPDATCYASETGSDYSCVCRPDFIGDGRTCYPVDFTTCRDSPCFPGVTCSELDYSNSVPDTLERYTFDNGEVKFYKCGECPSLYQGNGSVCYRISGELEPKISPRMTVIVNDNYNPRPVRNANINVKLKSLDYTTGYVEGLTSADGIVHLPLPVSDEMMVITFSHQNFFDTSITFKPIKEHNNIATIVVQQRENSETTEFFSENFNTISFFASTYSFFITQDALSGVVPGDRIEASLFSAQFEDENSLEGIPELIAIVPDEDDESGSTKYGYLEAVAIIKMELTNLRTGEPVHFLGPISAIVPIQTEVFRSNEFGNNLKLWSYDNDKGVWISDMTGISRESNEDPGSFSWITPLQTTSWVAAGRSWPKEQVQCVYILTCADDEYCSKRIPHVQIWVTGLDHWYTTTRTTDQNGQTCINLLEGREYLFRSCYSELQATVSSPSGGGASLQENACPMDVGGQWQDSDGQGGQRGCFTISMFANERPISCTKPEDVDMAKKSGEDFYFGADVNYTCQAGYLIIGSSQRVCQGCGVWSGNLPYCFS